MEIQPQDIATLAGSLGLLEDRIGYLTVMLLVLWGTLVGIFVYLMLREYRSRQADRNRFDSNRAHELFERDNIAQLIDYSETVLVSHPNNIEAKWFLGLAHYHRGNYHEALVQFHEIVELNPHWRDDPIGPYVQEIEERLKEAGLSYQKH